MGNSLGTVFLDGACAPLDHAGRCVMARQVVAALHGLHSGTLIGAVRSSVATVAKEAGVSTEDVERLLPLAELQRVAGVVGQAQQQALEAWQVHAGHVGGLLEGLTDLTQDSRPPDVSLCLERLSQKLAADRAWSEPLRQLSIDVHHWRELLRECRSLIDTGGSLERSRRRHKFRRMFLLVSMGMVVLGTAIAGLWVWLCVYTARQRIDEVLLNGDPCATERLDPGDLQYASKEQEGLAAEQQRKCREQRQQEQQRQEAERQAAEQKRKQAAAAKQEEEKCSTLVTAVRAGKLDPAQAALAGDAADLVSRIAWGKLDPTDLAPPDPELPCSKVSSSLDPLFDQAVLSSTSAWLQADDLSDRVQKVLVAHQAEIGERPKLLFALHAETKAQRALVSGDTEELERARRLCALKKALKVNRGTFCDTL